MNWDRQCLEDSEQKDHIMNELINHKAVYSPGCTESVKHCKTCVKYNEDKKKTEASQK